MSYRNNDQRYSQNEFGFERRGDSFAGNRNYKASGNGYDQGYRDREPHWDNRGGPPRDDRSDSYYSGRSSSNSYPPDQRPGGYAGKPTPPSSHSQREDPYRSQQYSQRYEEPMDSYSTDDYSVNRNSQGASNSGNYNPHPYDSSYKKPKTHQSSSYDVDNRTPSYGYNNDRKPYTQPYERPDSASFRNNYSYPDSGSSNPSDYEYQREGYSYRNTDYNQKAAGNRSSGGSNYNQSNRSNAPNMPPDNNPNNYQRYPGPNNEYGNYKQSFKNNKPGNSQPGFSRDDYANQNQGQNPNPPSKRPDVLYGESFNVPDYSEPPAESWVPPPSKGKKPRPPQTPREVKSAKLRKRAKSLKKMQNKVWQLTCNYAQKGPQGEEKSETIKGGESNFLEDCITQRMGKVEFAPEEIVLEREAPMCKLPYLEQVKIKDECGKKLVKKICDDMSSLSETVKKFLVQYKEKNNGFPCKILDVVYNGTNYDNYRSRVDLVVGPDYKTKKPCAGIRLGNAQHAAIEDHLPTMPKIILHHIKVFERFLSQSQFEVSTYETRDNFVWSHLAFRIGVKTNHVMMIPGFSTTDLHDARINTARNEVRNFYKGKEMEGIKSLYIQIIRRRNKNGPSHHHNHLLGDKYIEEVVHGIKFKLDAHAEFGNCQFGAELINDTVRSMGRLNSNSILIDVSSPMGMVSLCLSKDVKKSFFIETKGTPQYFLNAQKTLENLTSDFEIKNWDKCLGKLEKTLNMALQKCNVTEDSDCLVYFDAWCGLRDKGVIACKNSKEINRLLFLTCGKKLMMMNFRELAVESDSYTDEEVFVPVEACSIDTYPHTKKMSIFVLFERIKIAKARLQ